MKHYKDYPKVYIGYSDSAFLKVVEYGVVDDTTMHELKFGEDGDYYAYIVWDDGAIIGDHYKLEHSFKKAITIVDDSNDQTFKATADQINVYQAGEFGCIIQLIGDHKSFECNFGKYTVIDGELKEC